MRARLFLVLLFAGVIGTVSYRPVAETRRLPETRIAEGQLEPQFHRAIASGISPTVRSVAGPPKYTRPANSSKLEVREVFEPEENEVDEHENILHDPDGSPATITASPMPMPSLSVDGLSNYNNIDLYNALIIPPDPIGDVGPNHYVQAVNSAIRIY